MAWEIEEGIGEHRAILADGGRIVAARIEWPGALSAGQIEDAVLIARSAGSPRGTLRFTGGEEALVDGLPPGASEGALLRARVTRAAVAETGRHKRAQARPTHEAPRAAPSLADRLRAEGQQARLVRRFSADWEELVAEARDGEIAFGGGTLTISPTPAMTVIDIDGTLPPDRLAVAAVAPIAAAIRRLGLGGSIGIDFPTLAEKRARREVDTALAEELAGWPHERTAMNGFGFVQLVARLEGPSLLHRIRSRPVEAAARLLLRRAEHLEGAGTLLVSAHPSVKAAIKPEWSDELSRRTGRILRWQEDAGLAIEGGHAQLVQA